MRQIWDLFQSHIGTVVCSGECADGIERAFSSAGAVLRFNNATQKQIIGMVFEARSKDRENFANLEFSENNRAPVSVRISGSEEVVARLKDAVEDVIYGMKPWYSRVTRLDFSYVALAMFMPLLLFLQAYSHGKRIKSETIGEAISEAVVSIIFVAIILVSVWLMNKLRQRLFPIGSFALGQGKDRYAFDEKVRWAFVGVAVPLIIALISGPVWRIITRIIVA